VLAFLFWEINLEGTKKILAEKNPRESKFAKKFTQLAQMGEIPKKSQKQ
jgi:hypothetical protein